MPGLRERSVSGPGFSRRNSKGKHIREHWIER